jgi:hypothetical protein
MDWIKSIDTFGFPITLNYKKKGDTHKTLVGGLVTIIVYFLFILYLLLKLKIMIWKDSNTITFSEYARPGNAEAINYDSMGITLYFMPKEYGKSSEILREENSEE